MATALLKSLDVRSATFCPCLKKGAFPCFPRLPLSFFLMSTLLRLCLPSSLLAGDPDWSEDHAERNANWSKNQKMQDYTLHTTLKLVVMAIPLLLSSLLFLVLSSLFLFSLLFLLLSLLLFSSALLLLLASLLLTLVFLLSSSLLLTLVLLVSLIIGAVLVHTSAGPLLYLSFQLLHPQENARHTQKKHVAWHVNMWTSSGCNAVLWSCCSFCSSSRFSSCRFCRSFHQSSFTFTWLMHQHNYASQKHQQTLTIKSLWLENTDFFSTYRLWEWNLKNKRTFPWRSSPSSLSWTKLGQLLRHSVANPRSSKSNLRQLIWCIMVQMV